MNILVACEYSGTVRRAFAAKGHNVWSCDLIQSDDDSANHIQDDCVKVIKRGWDIIIAHPPCTALTVAGNSTYGDGQKKYQARLDAVAWTADLWALMKRESTVGCALENPVGVLPRMAGMKCSQYIQPYQFGHKEQKKTGLWLDRLPPLEPTTIVYDAMMELPKRERERLHYLPPSPDRWKIRSTTFSGIAKAMAEQWSII